VLRYDSDYDLIAAVTGQPMQWVVPRDHPLTSPAPSPASARREPHAARSRPGMAAQIGRDPDSLSPPA
jgi:hypothetical protein